MQRHRHLAIRPLSNASAVLVLDANRVPALLDEAGVIEDEACLGAVVALAHHCAVLPQDELRVPFALIQPVPDRLHGVLVAQRAGSSTRAIRGSTLFRSPS